MTELSIPASPETVHAASPQSALVPPPAAPPGPSLEPTRNASPVAARSSRATSVARDLLLVLLGGALAYTADVIRDRQSEQRRVAYAVESIRSELLENQARVERARAWHLSMMDTLKSYQSRRQLPPERVYYGGLLAPATLTSAAWQTARESGAITAVPYPMLLALAPIYQRQEDYNDLASATAHAMMIDARRHGSVAVFRDGFAELINIEMDFANRETVLARHYTTTLATLDSLVAARKR